MWKVVIRLVVPLTAVYTYLRTKFYISSKKLLQTNR